MTELYFVVALGIATLGVAMPALTLLSKGCLWLWRRRTPLGNARLPYALLIAPTLLPLAWLAAFAIAPALHGAGQSTQVDLLMRLCPGALGWFLFGLGVCASVMRGQATQVRAHLRTLPPAAEDHPARARLARLRAATPALQKLRLHVVEGAHHQVFTCGFSRREVRLSVAFIQQLDDDAELLAALLHELEHSRGHDPLRNALLDACLILNPFGALLRREASQWRLAREIHCDRRAVLDGASPLALAEALMSVARPCSTRCGCVAIAALGGPAMQGVELRVHLLLGYLSAPPRTHTTPITESAVTSLLVGLGVASLIAGPHLFENLHRFADALARMLS